MRSETPTLRPMEGDVAKLLTYLRETEPRLLGTTVPEMLEMGVDALLERLRSGDTQQIVPERRANNLPSPRGSSVHSPGFPIS